MATAAVLLLLALPAWPQEPTPDRLAANKEVIRRYVEEVLSTGNLQVLDSLVTADYVDSSPGAPEGHGPEVIRAAQTRLRGLFRDIHYRVDQLVAEGDKVVARYTVHAIRKEDKEVKEVDAGDGGKEIGILGITIFRLVDGRIRETWTINDQLTMFRQLGYVLTSPKAQRSAGEKPVQPPGR